MPRRSLSRRKNDAAYVQKNVMSFGNAGQKTRVTTTQNALGLNEQNGFTAESNGAKIRNILHLSMSAAAAWVRNSKMLPCIGRQSDLYSFIDFGRTTGPLRQRYRGARSDPFQISTKLALGSISSRLDAIMDQKGTFHGYRNGKIL